MRLLLIRHCESSGQAPEAPLTPNGARAAVDLAGRLADLGVDAAYSSPFVRAQQTLLPFTKPRGLPLTLDDRLAERRLSPAPRVDWLELIRRSFDDFDHAVPGGESLREAQRRAIAALADVAAREHRLPAVVTHGNLLSSVLRHADASFGFEAWQSLRNPDLFIVTMGRGRPLAFERLEP